MGPGDAGSNTARTSTIRRNLRVQREVAAYFSELQLPGRHRHSRLDGMLAEYAVLSEETVVPLPGISPSRKPRPMPRGHRLGGTDPRWRVTAGDTVRTQGSGGGSVFALQFSRVLDAQLIATTSTARRPSSSSAGGFRCDQLHEKTD